MSEFNCNDPAFPFSDLAQGMSYRQWLIGQALTGALSAKTSPEYWEEAGIASFCVNVADAVIAEMTKPQP